MYTLGKIEGHERPLALTDTDRRRHLYLIGRTGTGKTVLLENLIRQDIEAGRGFALLDPHGDLSRTIADSVPPHRIQDTTYFDPLDTHVVGYNPLSFRSTPLHRATITAHLVASFRHVWSDFWGPRMEYILKNTIRLLLDKSGTSLIDITRVLSDESYRHKLLHKCTDQYVVSFWRDEFENWDKRYKRDAVAPIQNKAGQFATDPILRGVVGQKNNLNLRRIMDHRKILLCNLSKAMGDDPAHLLGAFLVTGFYQAAMSRADIAEDEREDFTLYVDEFQAYSTDTFATILSEARKYRLSLVLANQFLGQLPELLSDAVIANVGTLCVFRIGAKDASLFARELNTDPGALLETPNFHAWAKRADTVQFSTFPPQQSLGSLEKVVAHTRARYALDRRLIEKRGR